MNPVLFVCLSLVLWILIVLAALVLLATLGLTALASLCVIIDKMRGNRED